MAYKNPLDPRAREARLKYYRKNIEKYILSAAKTKRRLSQLVRDLKDGPCTDCKNKYPYYVMHFDHLVNKKYNVSSMYRYSSERKIIEEVSKCELVCANCHAERTHVRRVSKSL